MQIDETYTGNTSKRAKSYKKGLKDKRAVVALSDVERAALALKGIEGKRLTYRRPDNAKVH